MTTLDLRFRQIHLDFHTSEKIENVASQFDPEEFAMTLERARVDSITCFARCHHGMLYYDSQEFPERIHPHLQNKNLLKEQIEACHKRGIRVPIYITVQWDYYTAQRHPEWHVVDAENVGVDPVNGNQKIYEPGFYTYLCVNSPYRDFLKRQTKEVLESLPTDGIFFDIVKPVDCSCKHCRKDMERRGMEPSNKQHRLEFAQEMINSFKLEMTQFVRKFNQECSVFYNRGHVGTMHRDAVDAYTHFELESLPSGHWGYLHFPISMAYARNLGLDCLAHTGKFHTSWGDFHSFKNKAALQFECFRMLALGSKCLIGDQLEPSGKLSKPVYDLIGSVYSEVEKKEPWCKNTLPLVDIGVFTPEEFADIDKKRELAPSIKGIVRMLQESGHQFNIIDSKSDLTPYKVVILPDDIPVSQELNLKIKEYLNNGGSLIASFESGMDQKKSKFVLDNLGIRQRENPTTNGDHKLVRGKNFPRNNYTDYILPEGQIGKGLSETEHAMYMKGVEVEVEEGAEVLAYTIKSYFDRTYKHFCSHLQTPSSGQVDYPGVVKNQSTIYFSHPIFTIYDMRAPLWCKQLFLNALDILLPNPMLRHYGPSTLLTTLNEQSKEKRWILHLLHYIPERRSQTIDIIEDVIPLYNIKISINATEDVKNVMCVPENQSLEYEIKDDRVEFTLPKLEGHQMVSIEF